MPAVKVILFCVLLAGCAQGRGGYDAVPLGAACPPVKAYTAKSQSRVKAELRACGRGCRHLSEWVKDYYVLRQQIRACRTHR